jgi:hypothetical protein
MVEAHDQHSCHTKYTRLEELSYEQLGTFVREVEWILSLLEDVVPSRLPQEARAEYKTFLAQTYSLDDRLKMERARRTLASIEDMIGS